MESEQVGALTVPDVTVPDLLQHLRPYRSVDRLVLVHNLGLELDDLCKASGWISGSRITRYCPCWGS